MFTAAAAAERTYECADRPPTLPPPFINTHDAYIIPMYPPLPPRPPLPLPSLFSSAIYKPNSIQGKEKKNRAWPIHAVPFKTNTWPVGRCQPPHPHSTHTHTCPSPPSPTPDFRELLIESRHGRTARREGGQAADGGKRGERGAA